MIHRTQRWSLTVTDGSRIAEKQDRKITLKAFSCRGVATHVRHTARYHEYMDTVLMENTPEIRLGEGPWIFPYYELIVRPWGWMQRKAVLPTQKDPSGLSARLHAELKLLCTGFMARADGLVNTVQGCVAIR